MANSLTVHYDVHILFCCSIHILWKALELLMISLSGVSYSIIRPSETVITRSQFRQLLGRCEIMSTVDFEKARLIVLQMAASICWSNDEVASSRHSTFTWQSSARMMQMICFSPRLRLLSWSLMVAFRPPSFRMIAFASHCSIACQICRSVSCFLGSRLSARKVID